MVALYLDADVDPLAARELRERGHNVLSAYDAGLSRASDLEHLEYAAHEGRALVTFNIKHFAPLYTAWWDEGRAHAGILVSPEYKRSEIGELLRLLENVCLFATDDDLANRLRYLSEFDV